MASRYENNVYPEEQVIEIELDTSIVETPYQSLPQEQQNGLDSEELKKLKEQTVNFEDGVRKIDFILTYQDHERQEELIEGKKSPDHGESGEKSKATKRRLKREKFLNSCRELGLELEFQDCNESPDRKTFYVKIHGTHNALLKGAEELLLKMPIRENNLHQSDWRERFFDWIKVRDPFEPVVPDHLEIENYFTAPFDYERRENYIGWDDKKKFFTTAQRSAIVWNHLQNARYGDEDDQIGILRLLQNGCFNNAFPLHDSSHKQKKEERDDSKMTERQFLYHRWSYWTNWYKRQPLDNIRRYFGEKIGIYFTWIGFYTTWLLPASIVGLIVFIYGLSTVVNPVATDICAPELRYDFYMCPRCDGRCDFWFLTDSCTFSRLAQVFDNGGTVFFAIFMSFWAVFFLEFWKRRQFFLQYDWDMLGYEDAEQRARPQFEQRIKRAIRARGNTEEARKKFTIHNPVLEKDEYIQPPYWLWPKVVTTIVILSFMIVVVLGIVLSVLLYRLAVAGAIYALVNGFPLGPTVGDIIVAVTGACIQLVFILIMNKIYGFLAYQLTNWELHRTQTEYEDQFTFKMYIFQFFNFYTSLFYIAFIKGNVSGNPGDYARISGLRVDECATYGCLFELTIQLAIIMVGKQILNNVQELSLPYVKRILNWIKHKEETEEDVYTRWEKDFDLIPLDKHGLFSEYLELVIQYGFITIFVVAFPLAPLFALLNNWVEIRLDAHKFTTVLRRPVAERAQDIGAWFYILTVISQLAVISNAFLIAITAQLVPMEVYTFGYRFDPEYNVVGVGNRRASGFVDFTLSEFQIINLLDGDAFPGFAAQELQLYNGPDRVQDDNGNDLLYLPFIDFECLRGTIPSDMLVTRPDPRPGYSGNITSVTLATWRSLTFQNTNKTLAQEIYDLTVQPSGNSVQGIPGESNRGALPRECFNSTVLCRYRGFVEDGFNSTGNSEFDTIRGTRFWQVVTARLAFVIVFEHVIFVIAAVIAFVIPDVPQSVKNEIQREKLLAFEAIHARQEEASEEHQDKTGSGD